MDAIVNQKLEAQLNLHKLRTALMSLKSGISHTN